MRLLWLSVEVNIFSDDTFFSLGKKWLCRCLWVSRYHHFKSGCWKVVQHGSQLILLLRLCFKVLWQSDC